MNRSSIICTAFLTLACVLVSASAYCQDLDVTMDVVKQPDKKDITESMMNKIEMPNPAKQKAVKGESGNQDSRDQKGGKRRQDLHQRHENSRGTQKMHEKKTNAREDRTNKREKKQGSGKDKQKKRNNNMDHRPDDGGSQQPDSGANNPDKRKNGNVDNIHQ